MTDLPTAGLDLWRHHSVREPNAFFVPVARGEKRCRLNDWPDTRITAATAPRFFNGEPSNIARLNGPVSGNRVCLDLDDHTAVALADDYDLASGREHGRAAKRRSHRDFVSPVTRTRQLQDPHDQKMLLEVKAGRSLVIMPGSVHPSGEAYTFDRDGPPTELPAKEFMARVCRLAAANLAVKAATGSRHDYLMVLSGVAVRELGGERALRFLEPIARTLLPEDRHPGEIERLVNDAVARLDEGQRVKGFKTLAEAPSS
jgi:Bifunctional DNA primase/polymerase, N-terminal